MKKAITTLSAEYIQKGGCVDQQSIEQLQSKIPSVLATWLNNKGLELFLEKQSEPGNQLFDARAREIWTQKIQAPLFSPEAPEKQKEKGDTFYLRYGLTHPIRGNASITSTLRAEYECGGDPKWTLEPDGVLVKGWLHSNEIHMGYNLGLGNSEVNLSGGVQWTNRNPVYFAALQSTWPYGNTTVTVQSAKGGKMQIGVQHSKSSGNSKFEFSGGVERNGKKNSFHIQLNISTTF
ncbi:MAG: hypothetical protein MSQ05_00755 [Akkermansia sp.]|nr:hypothetical protein [Akkermansia sp.]